MRWQEMLPTSWYILVAITLVFLILLAISHLGGAEPFGVPKGIPCPNARRRKVGKGQRRRLQ